MNTNRLLDFFKGDKYLWIVVILLSIFGILAIFSSTEILSYKKETSIFFYFFKHFAIVIVSLIIAYFVQLVPYQYYSGNWKLLLPLSVIALIYAMFFGDKINEAGRWIKIPVINLTFQASDLAKVALVLFLARFMSKNQEHIKEFKRGFLPMIAVVGVICFLIFLENISTSIMVFIMAAVMMFVGRVNNLHLVGLIAALMLSAFLVITIMLKVPDEYLKIGRLRTAKTRIEHFGADNNEILYQVKHANIAIANGGILPNGPGNSRQKYFLPNAFSDYVYAIIIEEWGLLGGVIILALYLVFLYRIILIVLHSPRTFGALVALGLGLSIVIQAFVHIMVNVAIFPSTGVTLPFVSMGGSSILFFGFALGIIISVSKSVENDDLGKAPKKESYIEELEQQISVL
jgi:cell division protein FtsW